MLRTHRTAAITSARLALLFAIPLALIASPAAGAGEPARTSGPAKPLLAHWTFDEEFGTICADASGSGRDAAAEGRAALGVGRAEGVLGNALALSGDHSVEVPAAALGLGPLPEISLSAWVLPQDLREYREIFRKEDGDARVLFSFQGDGKILSLGLNVGGYVECDAPVDPSRLLDGAWHHCAASFDGRRMRVYLDGKEVGSLERPGTIRAGGPAPGCIGSSSGGECFQGLLDDLRIYTAALGAAEIAALHEEGRRAVDGDSGVLPAGEPEVGRALLAHWTANERGGPVLHDGAGKPPADAKGRAPIGRARGVHGRALELRGRHALEAAIGPRLPGMAITLAAWTRPADLSGFREIFRQEGAHRVLFSFQEGGTILSLGLDIGGYIECDATVDPGRLLDGDWHHAAATFDGERMRVYFDGKEIGSLHRPGAIAVDASTPAFVGSSGGGGEHFQGGLDDLRIYGEALPADAIARLHSAGRDVLDRAAREMESALAALYVRDPSFAETLASSWKALREGKLRLDRDLAAAFGRKIRADFPEECGRLAAWTGASAIDAIASRDAAPFARHAERLAELLTEYRPLTEEQWRRTAPEDIARWKEIDAIRARFDALKVRGAEAGPAEWISLILEAGPRIALRPAIHEPVAPYMRPSTPETRSLEAAEAREVLRRDWLHQAGGDPSPERIRKEIGWARDLARRIAALGADLGQDIADLDALEKRAAGIAAPDRDLYFEVREAKRRIALKNPLVDFDSVLFVDSPYPQGSEWQHETRHRLGYMAVPGGRLLVLEGLSPAGKLRQLLPQAPLHGSFWRPDLSFDADRVVVSFKAHNEKAFHLWEVGIDGSRPVQLTGGPYDDFDPIYLPDERHIIFSTSRAHTYVRCMPPTNAFVLARCDRDGRNIYFVSQNNEPDYLPSVMDDGRILYTRWEYTDKPLWRAQKLWTMNPDGTGIAMYWGNQSVWPDLMKDARSIPGTTRVMFTGSAHHNWFSGSVGIVDIAKGLNFPGGLTKVTADVPWPECGNGPVDPIEAADYHPSGACTAYYSPYPLGEEDFLVSAQRGGKFLLYLMDVHGNRELIHEGTHNVFHAQPLRPRRRPVVIPDRVVWPTREDRLRPQDGIIYSANVDEGVPAGLAGKAKALRILSIDAKTYTYWYKRPYISTGPVVSAVQSEGVKRILGTVPIEADRSVAFRAPPGIPLHFQLLDGEGRALHTMRSFTGLMPGERRGCLGCHELHSRAPAQEPPSLAASKAPRAIEPPPWTDRTVSFARYVQPTLDRYCGKCHQGEGKARKTLDLTSRPGFLDFTEPYLTLIGRPSWGEPYRRPADAGPGFGIAGMLMVEAFGTVDPLAYKTPEPMSALSFKSKLVEIASSGKHHDVKVDPVSLARLIAWVDAMCPFLGEEEIRAIPDPQFQGVDWISVRPRIRTAPVIVRPGPLDD